MKWFGEPWNSDLCEPASRVRVPVDAFCTSCERPVLERDQGVLLASGHVYHLDCFLHSLGVIPCSPRFHPPVKETLS